MAKRKTSGLRFSLALRLRKLNYWLIAQVAMAAMALLRLLPMDSALNFADRAARRAGPLVGRNRVALDNLRKAYPDKREDEIRAIASDMWGNMARLAAEYVFLDRIFDFDPKNPGHGRIEVPPDSVARFERIAGEDRPHILFTAHLGNFELLPVAAAAFGMKVTALFRPPNNPYLADYILSTRRSNMGDLQPSSTGASFALASVLESGGNVGVLVDQKFTRGVETQFFGRTCQSNPVLGMLARQFDCDVYPARCIRLPGNRYRLEIEEPLALPRDRKGAVDVAATTQILADVVERWVREDPGQWMWFHKRWRITGPSRTMRKAA